MSQDDKDELLLWALHNYDWWRARWPTRRKLAQAVCLRSPSLITERLKRLREQGLVEGGEHYTGRTMHPARNVAFITEGGVRSIGIAEPMT